MNGEVKKVNQILKKYLINSNVESFGIMHQSLFLEFRTESLEDVSFYLDTDIKIMPDLNNENISPEEYQLLCLNKVNLRKVIDIVIEVNDDLSICFDNNIVLTFLANNQTTEEIWSFKDAAQEIHIIAFSGGGYAIWDLT